MSDEMPEFTDAPHRWTIEPHPNPDFDALVTNCDHEARHWILQIAESHLWDDNDGEERTMRVTMNKAIANVPSVPVVADLDAALNGNERGVLNVLAGNYHRDNHQGNVLECDQWPCTVLLESAAPVSPTASKCVKCGHNNLHADGIHCQETIWHETDTTATPEVCGCKCEFEGDSNA